MPDDASASFDLITPLISLSRAYGGDPAFVLAGGGNTSVKTADRLHVKASGHALATIDADGFVELDRAPLAAMLGRTWPTDPADREAAFKDAMLAARVHPDRGQRPSVEALIHHLMPGRFVVHTHPGIVNALTCCVRGQALAARHLPDAIWQPYVDPGVTLAQALHRLIAPAATSAHPPHPPHLPHGCTVVLLENHGLIVSGNDPDAIRDVSDRLINTLQTLIDSQSDPPGTGFIPGTGTSVPVPPPDDFPPDDSPPTDSHLNDLLAAWHHHLQQAAPAHAVAADNSAALRWLTCTDAGHAAALAGPLTPDQIVYCRSLPLWIDDPAAQPADIARQYAEAAANYEASFGHAPWVVLLAGVGGLMLRESEKLADITRAVYADAAAVAHHAHRLGGVQPLTTPHRRFIEDWEVEAYRRQIAAGK